MISTTVEITPWQHASLASVGTCFTSCLVHPLEVLKTRQQANTITNENIAPRSIANNVRSICSAITLKNLKELKRCIKFQNYRILYAGLTPTLLMSIPSAAVFFPTYELVMKLGKPMESNNSKHHLVRHGIAAAVARLLVVCVSSPLEVVRTKMQVEMSSMSLLQRLKSIHQERLYSRGLGATIARDVPFSAMYFIILEQTRLLFADHSKLSSTSPSGVAFIGGVAGGVAASIATHPFDIIKTKQQTDLATTNSVWVEISSIIKHQRVRGLTVGLKARILRIVPACAIMIATYEGGKSLIASNQGQKQ